MTAFTARSSLYCLVGYIFSIIVLSEPSQSQLIPEPNLPANDTSRITEISESELLIEGGAHRGDLLFHSFQDFNIRSGNDVYFVQPDTINTIISRVIGSNPSQIDGGLGVGVPSELGTADLFFMNPNGIIFGPNSRLNMNGSFIATTASSIAFGNRYDFRADSRNDNIPLLIVHGPTGLQFGQDPGRIENQSRVRSDNGSRPVGLLGSPGETLALLGGEIRLSSFSFITIADGHLTIGSVGSNSQVGLSPTSTGWEFNYQSVDSFQNVTAETASILLALEENFSQSSTAQFYGRNIVFQDSSIGADNSRSEGGILTIVATENLTLGNFSNIRQDAEDEGSANSIILRAPQLTVRQGSGISSASSGSGDGGNIRIDAESILIEGTNLLNNSMSQISTRSNSEGSAGDIDINTNTLILRDGGELTSLVSVAQEDGDVLTNAAGNIRVNADLILLDDNAQITASTTGGQGNIFLNTNTLLLNDGSIISARATGTASGGDVLIDTNTLTALNSSRIDASARRGDGGRIQIIGEGLILSFDSTLDVSSQFGIDGTIEILTPDSDPVEERIEDSGQPVDVTELVSTKSCTTRRDGSSFYIVGRGGLRESPLDPLLPDLMWEDWETVEAVMHIFDDLVPVDNEAVSPMSETGETDTSPLDINPPGQNSVDRSLASHPKSLSVVADHTVAPPEGRLIETQGWMRHEDGTVVLLSQAATPTAQGMFLHPHDCQLLQEGLRANRS